MGIPHRCVDVSTLRTAYLKPRFEQAVTRVRLVGEQWCRLTGVDAVQIGLHGLDREVGDDGFQGPTCPDLQCHMSMSHVNVQEQPHSFHPHSSDLITPDLTSTLMGQANQSGKESWLEP
jgi:hypothetical protein